MYRHDSSIHCHLRGKHLYGCRDIPPPHLQLVSLDTSKHGPSNQYITAIWGLKMPLAQRLGVLAMFSVGLV